MFMEAKGMEQEATEEAMKTEMHKATKLKMLQQWYGRTGIEPK